MTAFENQLLQQGITFSAWLDNALWLAYENREKYGNLRGLQATADDVLKTEDALIRADFEGSGSVAEIDAWVRQQIPHLDAVEEKKNKYADWTRAEIAMKLLYAMKDKYQTDSKLARDMDQAHR